MCITAQLYACGAETHTNRIANKDITRGTCSCIQKSYLLPSLDDCCDCINMGIKQHNLPLSTLELARALGLIPKDLTEHDWANNEFSVVSGSALGDSLSRNDGGNGLNDDGHGESPKGTPASRVPATLPATAYIAPPTAVDNIEDTTAPVLPKPAIKAPAVIAQEIAWAAPADFSTPAEPGVTHYPTTTSNDTLQTTLLRDAIKTHLPVSAKAVTVAPSDLPNCTNNPTTPTGPASKVVSLSVVNFKNIPTHDPSDFAHRYLTTSTSGSSPEGSDRKGKGRMMQLINEILPDRAEDSDATLANLAYGRGSKYASTTDGDGKPFASENVFGVPQAVVSQDAGANSELAVRMAKFKDMEAQITRLQAVKDAGKAEIVAREAEVGKVQAEAEAKRNEDDS